MDKTKSMWRDVVAWLGVGALIYTGLGIAALAIMKVSGAALDGESPAEPPAVHQTTDD